MTYQKVKKVISKAKKHAVSSNLSQSLKSQRKKKFRLGFFGDTDEEIMNPLHPPSEKKLEANVALNPIESEADLDLESQNSFSSES